MPGEHGQSKRLSHRQTQAAFGFKGGRSLGGRHRNQQRTFGILVKLQFGNRSQFA